ncbi:hypothetical protein LCGC14_0852630 [marine sediment metagenome]|uniref:Uncharacterized protein n=1 Tax=marine sediment metagenome TaxID=412755 RepID=A0A0F9SGW5_9ZZZZ
MEIKVPLVNLLCGGFVAFVTGFLFNETLRHFGVF